MTQGEQRAYNAMQIFPSESDATPEVEAESTDVENNENYTDNLPDDDLHCETSENSSI